jgi:threonine dehydrogenase-like Zn-dependent dehydrogenase
MLVSMTLGCGPVGQFAIRSAFLLGAERVIAIDTVPGQPGHHKNLLLRALDEGVSSL